MPEFRSRSKPFLDMASHSVLVAEENLSPEESFDERIKEVKN